MGTASSKADRSESGGSGSRRGASPDRSSQGSSANSRSNSFRESSPTQDGSNPPASPSRSPLDSSNRRKLQSSYQDARNAPIMYKSMSASKMGELIKQDQEASDAGSVGAEDLDSVTEEEDEVMEDVASMPAMASSSNSFKSARSASSVGSRKSSTTFTGMEPIPCPFPAFNPEVISQNWKMTIKPEDKEDEVKVLTVQGHKMPIASLSINPVGGKIGAACKTGEANIFCHKTGTVQSLGESPSRLPISGVAYNCDGTFIATSGMDKSLRVWKPDTGKEVANSVAHDAFVTCVSFSQKDPLLLASGGGDKPLIRVWEINETEGPDGGLVLKERAVLTGHWAFLTSVHFSPDDEVLSSACQDGTIRLWDLTQAEPLANMGFSSTTIQDRTKCFKEGLRHISHRQMDDELVSDGAEQRFKWENPAFPNVMHLCKVQDSDGWGRQIESRYQYVDCENGEIIYTSSGWLRTFKGHTGPVNSVCFSGDGNTVASGGDDGTVRIWEAQTDINNELILDERFCEGTAGYHILSIEDEMTPGDAPQRMKIEADREIHFRIEASKIGYYFKHGSGGRPRGLRKMDKPDCSFQDRMRNPVYKIISEETGEVLFDWDTSASVLSGHKGPVTAVQFIYGGDKVISASDDGTVRLWDLDEECCVSVLTAPSLNPLSCMLVSFKPPALCLGDRAGSIHVIDGDNFASKFGA